MRCTKKGCKRYGKVCISAFLVFNNTPLGFLFEHAFWEKLPYTWMIPRMLGLH